MTSTPPSPGLTAVEDHYHDDHHPLHHIEPKSELTGGVPRTTDPIPDEAVSAGRINQPPPSALALENGQVHEKGTQHISATGPVPRAEMDPDAKTGKEHTQLESTNPDLYHALEKEHVYLTHRDEEGNYLVRSTKSDMQNPRNWPDWKRYFVVGLASWLNILV
jgi:hypothetical protein